MRRAEGLTPEAHDEGELVVDGDDVVDVIFEVFGPRDLRAISVEIGSIKLQVNEAYANRDVTSRKEALDLVKRLVLQTIKPN